MRIQELAIGDWVTFADSVKEGEIVPVLVAGITAPGICLGIIEPEGNDITQPCDELDVAELAGVPLTPEILEKNGWYIDSCWWEHHIVDFLIAERKSGYYLYADEEHDKREWFCRIQYVHELQHVLRLCGFEKEIEL